MVTNTCITLVHHQLLYFLPAILKSALVSQIHPILSCFHVFDLFSPVETSIITMLPLAPMPNCEAGPDIPNRTCAHPLNHGRAPFYFSFCIYLYALKLLLFLYVYYQRVNSLKGKELNSMSSFISCSY